ncbi:MAG TPA: LysM peptidoglycan-binding domain-containing protein [Firmicutes bacterium]|jgi:N-acetylmuramoyl-L-alanine amidase|nr:LysM peptidoglycan-binding domain-containing protein [Bacillota bacterium]
MVTGQLTAGGFKRTVVIMLFLGILFLFLGGRIAQGASHSVKQGDTLWLLAQKYNTSVQEIAAANNLSSPWIIYPEQILTIPVEIHNNQGFASREGRVAAPAGFSAQEIDLLARLVHSESAGEPYLGQVAVAATVLNRIKSPRYPNTISNVIYQVVGGCYQFSPVLDGRINRPASKTAFNAVYDALRGLDPSRSALGFYNPSKTRNQWVRQQQVTAIIGNHIFFR